MGITAQKHESSSPDANDRQWKRDRFRVRQYNGRYQMLRLTAVIRRGLDVWMAN